MVGCAELVGETSAFGGPLAVTGLAVDQQAALFAQSCHAAGEAKCTYGTGAFLLATVGERPIRSRAGLAACVAWRLAGRTTYCLDGQAYTAGAAVGWLQTIRRPPGREHVDALDADAAGVPFRTASRYRCALLASRRRARPSPV